MLSNRQKIAIYSILSFAGFLMIFPFLWTILGSFKPAHEIITVPPTIFPDSGTLDNYKQVFNAGQFGKWYFNSLFVGAIVTLSVCLFSSLAGYSLAKFKYPYKDSIFYFILSTMMVPLQMLIIPWYVMFSYFGLLNSYAGLIIPGMISAFGIFMLRQFCENIPDSLIEAARLDGASEIRIFTRIIMPLLKPSIAALAIITFIGNWNAFLWPLIIINDGSMQTLPIGLQGFAGQFGVEYHLILAAANLVVIPAIIIFVIAQRQIIESIASSGVKG